MLNYQHRNTMPDDIRRAEFKLLAKTLEKWLQYFYIISSHGAEQLCTFGRRGPGMCAHTRPSRTLPPPGSRRPLQLPRDRCPPGARGTSDDTRLQHIGAVAMPQLLIKSSLTSEILNAACVLSLVYSPVPSN